MAFEDYQTKDAIVVVYTGDSKGKTSASLGLMVRALGNRWRVAYIQFIKHWGVGEHVFIRDILPLYKDQLYFYKGGKGFYNAGDISAEHHRLVKVPHLWSHHVVGDIIRYLVYIIRLLAHQQIDGRELSRFQRLHQ